jgi:hypothetical protein
MMCCLNHEDTRTPSAFFFSSSSSSSSSGASWLRGPAIAYGGHVATTVILIIAEFVWSPLHTIPPTNLTWLVCAYTPYFLFPFWLALYMIYYNDPFSNLHQKKKVKSK